MFGRFELFKCCRISDNDHRQTDEESGERVNRGNTTIQSSYRRK